MNKEKFISNLNLVQESGDLKARSDLEQFYRDVEYMVNDKQLKTYKLFKVQTVVHNVQNYTSIINCYSVDVNYSSITQG